MNVIERNNQKAGMVGVVVVLLLSLPSLIFVILHALYAPSTLPEFFDLVVTWTITLTGMIGAATTLAAVVVAVIATLQSQVPRMAKVAMWASVSLSLLACIYLAGVRP